MDTIARIIFYGASLEILAAVIGLAVLVLAIGLINRAFLWRVVRGVE